MHLQYWQLPSVCYFQLLLQKIGKKKANGQWKSKFQCWREEFIFLLMICKMTFTSLQQKQNKNKNHPHTSGRKLEYQSPWKSASDQLMNGHQAHTPRTDVPLEGKEKSQTPELPVQQFILKDAVICFMRDMAQKVRLAKGGECENGLMPPLCCTDSRLLQGANPPRKLEQLQGLLWNYILLLYRGCQWLSHSPGLYSPSCYRHSPPSSQKLGQESAANEASTAQALPLTHCQFIYYKPKQNTVMTTT